MKWLLPILFIYTGLPGLAWGSESPCDLLLAHAPAIQDLASKVQEYETISLDPTKSMLASAIAQEIATQQAELLNLGITEDKLQAAIRLHIQSGAAAALSDEAVPTEPKEGSREKSLSPKKGKLSPEALERKLPEIDVAIEWAKKKKLRIGKAILNSLLFEHASITLGLIQGVENFEALCALDPKYRRYSLAFDLNSNLPSGEKVLAKAIEMEEDAVAIHLIHGGVVPDFKNTPLWDADDITFLPLVEALIDEGYVFQLSDVIAMAPNPGLNGSIAKMVKHQPDLRNAVAMGLSDNDEPEEQSLLVQAMKLSNNELVRNLLLAGIDFPKIEGTLPAAYKFDIDVSFLPVAEAMIAQKYRFKHADILSIAENPKLGGSAKLILMANPNLIRSGDRKRNLFEVAAQANNGVLVSYLASLGIAQPTLEVALIDAAEKNANNSVTALIDSGAAPSDEALIAAVQGDAPQAAESLILAGADLRVKIGGLTLWEAVRDHYAAPSSMDKGEAWKEVVDLLVANDITE